MAQSFFNKVQILLQHFDKKATFCRTVNRSVCTPWQSIHALERQEAIVHVRYINILTWLRGFQDKLLYLVLFSLCPSLFWELRDKRNLENLQF